MRTFVDTNVLIYSISPKPEEQRKRKIACVILDERSCALSVQVLNEFMWQATHVRRPDRVSLDDALSMVAAWRRHPVQPLDLGLFDAAPKIHALTNYAWWDCMIIAAARATGCDTIATEDMQHGRIIDGVRIENPFAP